VTSPSNNPTTSVDTISPLGISFQDVYDSYFTPSNGNPTVGSPSDDQNIDIVIDQINGTVDTSSADVL